LFFVAVAFLLLTLVIDVSCTMSQANSCWGWNEWLFLLVAGAIIAALEVQLIFPFRANKI
jgi:hypothetical protein